MYRIVDAYLCEGPKVLIRFGLGLLKITKRRLKRCSNAAEVEETLRRWLQPGSSSSIPHEGATGFQHPYSFELLQVGRGCSTVDLLQIYTAGLARPLCKLRIPTVEKESLRRICAESVF